MVRQVPWCSADNLDKLDPETLCQYIGQVRELLACWPGPCAWLLPNAYLAEPKAAQVQETRDSEFYIGAYQLPGQPWMTSMYQDCGNVDFTQIQAHRIWERRSLSCIPLKGLSAWAATNIGCQSQAGPGDRQDCGAC